MHFDVVMISTLIREIVISLQPYTFTLPLLFSGGKSIHFKKARTCIERSEERYGSSFKIKASSSYSGATCFVLFLLEATF